MEIEKLIELYGDWRTVRGFSPLTIFSTKQHLLIFLKYLEEPHVTHVEFITSGLLQDFQEYLFYKTSAAGRLWAPNYRNLILVGLRGFLKWVKNQDYLAQDLSEHVVGVRYRKKLPKNVMTLEEVQNILKSPDTTTRFGFRDRLMLELFYGTGIRMQELSHIWVEDADLQQQQLYIRMGKGGKDRLVPLNPGLCNLIKEYLAFVRSKFLHGHDDSRYLIVGRSGGPLRHTRIDKIIRAHAQNAGLTRHISAHSFRHACATHMMQNGAPIRHIQELLGHADINTTQVYTHITISDLKKAHAKYHPRERMKIKEL
ncbi:MAG: tyrosine-type recombinase/integrase [Bdellovibrionota bacterium]